MPPDADASTPLTIIDLHLLAALLLRERLHTPSPLNPLAHARLAELCTGAYLPTVLPLSPHASRFLELDAPKVGYFCAQAKERRKHADNANVGAPALGPGDWLHKNLDGRLMFTLDEEGAEEAFGRTRLAVGNGRGNSVYVLALALQHVLDALPPHAARVRVRTADGLSFECGVGEFEWTQLAVIPREAVYVCHSTLAPPEEGEETVMLRHWVFGKAGEVVPWVYLTFKNPKTGPRAGADENKADTEADDANMENETETDTQDIPAADADADADDDAILDLSSLLLGSGINNNNARGPGGELFALVRARAYERVILAPRTATMDQERITSRRLAVEELRCKGTEEEARELARRVLEKLGVGAGAGGVVGAGEGEGEGEGKEDMGVNANRDVGMVEGADDPNPDPDSGNAQNHPRPTYLDAFCAYCGRAEPRAVCSRCSGPGSVPDSTSTSTTSAAEGRPRPRPRERYCGQACQRKAWRYHKPWCRLDVPPPPKPPAPPAPEPAPEPKPEEKEGEEKKDGEESSNTMDEDEDSEGGEEDAEGENDEEDGEGEEDEEEEEKKKDGDGDGDGEKKDEKDEKDAGEAPKNGEDKKEGEGAHVDVDVEMKDE